MIPKTPAILALLVLLASCTEKPQPETPIENSENLEWTESKLKERANQHLDSNAWDRQLLAQDVETYQNYAEVFNDFPLNKSPFPVAEYDYAVSYIPFDLEMEQAHFKGVRIGEYPDPDGDVIADRMTLLVLCNDTNASEITLAESRNYPYLTAQGRFTVKNQDLEWVFASSPDGYSFLMVNMKLFDLRFGETIIIYPQPDQSFRYQQIEDSPNNYAEFEKFRQRITDNPQVSDWLN